MPPDHSKLAAGIANLTAQQQAAKETSAAITAEREAGGVEPQPGGAPPAETSPGEGEAK